MKSLIATICILGLVGMVAGVAVKADETVTATVTPQVISVSVSDGSVSYGILSADTNEDTTSSGVDNTQIATNDGNVPEKFSVKSSDATSTGTNWELAASTGTDDFMHEFCTLNCDGSPTWVDFNVDNTTYVTLVDSIAVSANQDFDLRIKTPTASTDSLEHSITVTVLAEAL